MNKTIKVIDLLNKIANGEKVPKTILFWGIEYKYDKEFNSYIREIVDDVWEDLMDNNNDELDKFLNDTVEIIEDNDKLENNTINTNKFRDIGKSMGQVYRGVLEGFIEGWNSMEEKLDER